MTLPGGMQLYALIGMVVTAVAAIGLVTALVLTGHDFSSPSVIQVLGFAAVIITTLAGLLGVHNTVQTVGTAINGKMTDLVNTTASNAFQQGQTAGPGAPVPPLPVPAPLAEPPVTP